MQWPETVAQGGIELGRVLLLLESLRKAAQAVGVFKFVKIGDAADAIGHRRLKTASPRACAALAQRKLGQAIGQLAVRRVVQS